MSDWDEQFKYKDHGLSFFVQGMKNFWELLGKEQGAMKQVIFWMIVTQGFAIAFPYLLKLVFDELPTIIESGSVSSYLIFVILAMFLVKTLGIFLTLFVKETIFLKSVIRLENAWPVMAQKKLLSLSFGYHERENTGKKVAKIDKGIEKMVDMCVDLSWSLLPQIAYLLINIIFMIVIDWRLGLLFFLPFIPAVWLNKRFYVRFSEDWERWEAKREESSGHFVQSLLNVKTVQDYVQERREQSRLQEIRTDMEVLDIDIHMMERYYFLGIRLILNLFFLATIVLGIYFVLQGTSTVGTIVFIIATGNVTIQSISEMFHTYTRMLRKLVSVNRMKEIMDAEMDITSSGQEPALDKVTGDIKFKSVKFAYPGKEAPVLQDFNLELEPRKMIALVGRSGEGKTTVAKLLCRVYDTTEGAITIDGMDIKDLDLAWYRRLFAIVQQDVDIFDTTLEANIAYPYPNATPEQIEEAVRASYIYSMIEKKDRFPDGLKTQVGERGIRLSGGERQRVGIARAYIALLSGAKVLVLDEATSSLDSETEVAIQSMLNTIRSKMDISIVAIAHRLSTIRKADMIYVINDGRVAEAGDHDRLLSKNGLYSRLVELQKLGELRG